MVVFNFSSFYLISDPCYLKPLEMQKYRYHNDNKSLYIKGNELSVLDCLFCYSGTFCGVFVLVRKLKGKK